MKLKVIDEFITEYTYFEGPIKHSKTIKIYHLDNNKFYYLNGDNEYIEINAENFT